MERNNCLAIHFVEWVITTSWVITTTRSYWVINDHRVIGYVYLLCCEKWAGIGPWADEANRLCSSHRNFDRPSRVIRNKSDGTKSQTSRKGHENICPITLHPKSFLATTILLSSPSFVSNRLAALSLGSGFRFCVLRLFVLEVVVYRNGIALCCFVAVAVRTALRCVVSLRLLSVRPSLKFPLTENEQRS